MSKKPKVDVPIELLFPSPLSDSTIAETRGVLHLNVEEGMDCPCCGQHVKLYPRRIDSNKARFLLSLVRLHCAKKDWIHYSECAYRGRDYPHLVHWDLVQSCPPDKSNKRTSGLWIPTTLGVSFVEGKIAMPEYAYVYDGRALGFSRQYIDIRKALGSKFDYAALMKARPDDRVWGNEHG